jgi:hypothetical protein
MRNLSDVTTEIMKLRATNATAVGKKMNLSAREFNAKLKALPRDPKKATAEHKKFIASLCKAVDVPKEVFAMKALEEKDVKRKEIFRDLAPVINGYLDSLLAKPKKRIKK